MNLFLNVTCFTSPLPVHCNRYAFYAGKTGDWKNHFSPELNKRIDKWIETNLVGTDLTFVTELEHQD